MIEKKTSKGDLEKRKNTFLLIGFVAVFGLIYFSFELFATTDIAKNLGIPEDPIVVVKEENVIATDPTPPPPIPQQTELILKIIDDTTPVFNDLDWLSQDFDIDMAIEDYIPIEFVPEEAADAPPAIFVEEMPEPIDGLEAMYIFLQSNLRYPEVARNNGISGQVLVEFVVEKDGTIGNVKVDIGVYPDLDQEAVRVVKLLPKWKPGKQMGKPVRCLYKIPIRFTINQ